MSILEDLKLAADQAWAVWERQPSFTNAIARDDTKLRYEFAQKVADEVSAQRDLALSELEGIAAFDSGRAGDVACRFLIDQGIWSARVRRIDGTDLQLPAHVPHRGSDVEAFIQMYRDQNVPAEVHYSAYNSMLLDYQQSADQGQKLGYRTSQ